MDHCEEILVSTNTHYCWS